MKSAWQVSQLLQSDGRSRYFCVLQLLLRFYRISNYLQNAIYI